MATASSSVAGSPRRAQVTCKTCRPCRQKKVKCDGHRPACNHCEASGSTCIFPRDARRESRPSKARVQSLENTVARMLDHMKASGLELPDLSNSPPPPSSPNEESSPSEEPHVTKEPGLTMLPTPPVSASPQATATQATALDLFPNRPVSVGGTASTHDVQLESRGELNVLQANDSMVEKQASFDADNAVNEWQANLPPYNVSSNDENGGDTSALSHCEARVAGVYHEQGCVSSVHGLSGMINPNLRQLHKKNISNLKWKNDAVAESKARLISNAVLQKQRELTLFREPRNLMDLDGCAPDLARRLVGLHFQRLCHGSMLIYRPAFMDSLASGGGPWANKVLLNAIYYASATCSDHGNLQSESTRDDMCRHFYDRFKCLLAADFDEPSIPTAAALLLVSSTLMAQGRSSAAWTLSGTAYRMIMDLGCHMVIDPNYRDCQNNERLLRLDLEQEARKRIYWAAYITDAAQALYMGRPCMFSRVEARVPLQFLDTFEELEVWAPSSEYNSTLARQYSCDPQPCYTVSTFISLTRLLRISTKITELYGIQTIKHNSDTLLDKYRSIEWDLENWRSSMAPHLYIDENSTFARPAHQFVPHVTFHALTILLHRAYMEEGHLRRHSNEAAKQRGAEACLKSALSIEKYLRTYRDAFGLSQAPILLSYAVYSAVTVILHEEHQNREQFTNKISFFWTCLNELHSGNNLGLKKPLKIIRDVVRELRINLEEGDLSSAAQQLNPSLEDSFFSGVGNGSRCGLISATTPSLSAASDWNVIDPFNPVYGMSPLGSFNGQETDISHDALYGLFAPTHTFS